MVGLSGSMQLMWNFKTGVAWKHGTGREEPKLRSPHATYNTIILLILLSSLAQPKLADLVPKSLTGNKDPGKTELERYSHRIISRARRHLKTINKRPLESIQSPDGDIIDCVAQDEQPAFDHPRLRDHKIQNVPIVFPEGLGSTQRKSGIQYLVGQLWHQNGTCPFGTVPIRRTSIQDVLRARSPSHFARKSHKPARTSPAPRIPMADGPSNSSAHEHAIAFVEGSEFYGARAVLSVWDPSVEASNEFSISQLWVLGGSFDGDLNSIEAGWQVCPELYGDEKPRLFTYWTTDGYQETGCYNLLCSGFVQTNADIAIGAAISPVSTFGGNQYQIEIMIWKDPREGNWWMAFEGWMVVGYWPAALFSHLAEEAASMVEWGGEVVNSRPDGRHTATQMGSGRFADDGFGAASFFHSLQVVDASNVLQPVTNLQLLAEHPNCYDVRSLQDANWGAAFYYGGPGRNVLCS